MNTFYTVTDNKITKFESVKPAEFIERFQRLAVYKAIKDIPVPYGHKLDKMQFVLTADGAKAAERQAAIERLTEIDRESLRPLRAIAAGTAIKTDTDKLTALETEAKQLRLTL